MTRRRHRKPTKRRFRGPHSTLHRKEPARSSRKRSNFRASWLAAARDRIAISPPRDEQH
jgi:hypothetical protein